LPIEDAWLAQHAGAAPPPSPHHPHGLARPDVVWFGEALPEAAVEAAWEAAQRCDLCLVVGTSGLVYPAAGLPEIAIGAGAYVVEINPERTPLSPRVSQRIAGTAAQVLAELLAVS
jgi:NAD-dependent deacetylase